MENILHILNGDTAIAPLYKSGIRGDHLVWREVLSEGPINHPFATEEFWQERNSYLTTAFDLNHNEYLAQIEVPFKKVIDQIETFNEICLWFEYDLFCQINMIALINYLGQIRRPHLQLTLICAGEIEGSDQLYGLGQLNPDQFQLLFKNRLKLGTREIEYANEVYNAYTDHDAESLYNYVLMPFNEFKYLNSALESHMRRFPYSDTGLTEIESKIVSLIKSGIKNESKIVSALLKWQKHYGFGDLQYFLILKSMKGLFSDYATLQLKEDLSFLHVEKMMDRNQQLGGACLKDWVYDVNEKTLTPRSQRLG